MAKKHQTTEQMALGGWGTWESDDNGEWTLNQINVASTVQCAVDLRAIRNLLQSILSNITQLGSDGIHEVIRAERARLRRVDRMRRAKNKRAREARRTRVAPGE